MLTKLLCHASRVAVIASIAMMAVLGGVGEAGAQQANGGSGPLVNLVPPAASLTSRAIADVGIVESDGSTTFTLAVRGLDAAPGTSYDARLHIGVCTAGDAGSVGPAYANTDALIGGTSGAVSLPFVVSAVGTGSALVTVPFLVPAGRANSIVLHDAKGSPVACLRVTIAEAEQPASSDQVLGVSQTAADTPTLAFTGSESAMLSAAGLGLIGAGTVALGVRRRRLHDHA